MKRRPGIAAIRRASLVVALAILAGGCGQRSPATQPGALRLAQVDWTESISMNHLVSQVVTSRFGRPVEVVKFEDAREAFRAVAEGRADVFLNAWLPTTHREHLAQYGPDLEDLGHIYTGAQIGLVVDAGSPAESIEDLKDYPELVPDVMVGLDTDSGILKATEKAAKVYGLDFRVGEAGHEELEEHIRKNIEDDGRVVFAGWRPHRRFRARALRFLADPKGVYGGPEEIRVVAQRGFSAREPQLAALLRAIEFDTASFEDLLDTVRKKKAETAAGVEAWRLGHAGDVERWVGPAPGAPNRAP